MLKPSLSLILLIASGLLSSCASFLQGDDIEPARDIVSYSERDGIQIWDDSAKFPFEKTRIVDDVEYVNGSTSKEVEDQAFAHARELKAAGLFIYRRNNKLQQGDIDVGTRRADLTVSGVDMEKYGVGPDSLHFGKRIKTGLALYEIKVKFFIYKPDSNRLNK